MSLPSRERGLKLVDMFHFYLQQHVAPFAGAWIEMLNAEDMADTIAVAPFAGAWIEMAYTQARPPRTWSLPSRERGLKYDDMYNKLCDTLVAPFAGAWIEILTAALPAPAARGRSLRGSVD